MVDKKVVLGRLEQIHQAIKQIEQFGDLKERDFLKDRNVQDICEYNLFIAINSMIDIVNHIVADENLGELSFLSDGFVILGEKGVFPQEDVDNYKKMVGFRNLIAHEYAGIDKRKVFEIIRRDLPFIRKFISVIRNYCCVDP